MGRRLLQRLLPLLLLALALGACGRRPVSASDAGSQPPGRTTRWALTAGGPGWDSAEAVAASPAGGICITGAFSGQARFGSHTLVSSGGTDAFVARLDADGTILWVSQGGGAAGDDGGVDVAGSGAGGCQVLGTFFGPARFGSHTLTSPGFGGLFVARLDRQGYFEHAVSITGDNHRPEPGGLVVDTGSDTYVAGATRGPARFGPQRLKPAGSRAAYVARLDSHGDFHWVAQIDGTGGEARATGITIDRDGGRWITGSFSGTVNAGTLTLTSTAPHDNDLFVARLDILGSFSLARTAGGSGQEYGGSIVYDGARDLLFTGAFSGTTRIGDRTLKSHGGAGQEFLAGMTTSGRFTWSGLTLSPPRLRRSPITAHIFNPMLASTLMGPSRLGSIPLQSPGRASALVVELDLNTASWWYTTAGAPGATTTANDLATDDGAQIYVVGSLKGTLPLGGATLSAASDDIWIWKLGPEGS
jgi:hypothetical protein